MNKILLIVLFYSFISCVKEDVVFISYYRLHQSPLVVSAYQPSWYGLVGIATWFPKRVLGQDSVMVSFQVLTSSQWLPKFRWSFSLTIVWHPLLREFLSLF
ncbi:hypothetical protein BY458DRAFT_508581 [Sporodiniella umbellata]|nr:hypothetical protein BY458DRAFT_508581 [Sporodiniella umbellata]